MGLCEISASSAETEQFFDKPQIIQQFKENRNGRFQQKRFYGVVGAGISLITADSLASVSMDLARIKNPYDAKGLPTTELGKTGVIIPKMVLGLGS